MIKMNRTFKLGTRGSQLAKIQSNWVASHFKNAEINLEIIKTDGDDLSLSLTSPSIPGAFVNALRNSLLNGEVDFIVHSLKDLPAELHPQIAMAAVPVREDVRDVLVSRENVSLSDLDRNEIIGTSSPRRTAFIANMRPDLITEPIRGNIDSRISKVRNGQYSAIILAAAGLARINKTNEASQFFSVDEILPAPGQGALAVECRIDDFEMIAMLSTINDPTTSITCTSERAILRELKAGCDLPIGAFAHLNQNRLVLKAELGNSESGQIKRVEKSLEIFSENDVQSAELLGIAVARELRKTE